MVGGDYLDRNLDALAPEGRLVQIAFLGGASAVLNLWKVMAKRVTITGSTLRSRSVDEKGAIARAVQREVWPLVEEGLMKPVIHATFHLTRASDAHRLLESNEHIGKVVLVTSAAS
jgi:NADPH:quinone reductase-like Zn-dependent oxidoreductase